MEVMSKSVYKDGVLYKVVDKKGIHILSEPSLGKKIQEGKVVNATVVNKKGSRPFVRLAPGTMNHNFDTLPIPEFTDSADKKEANIAKKWALAKKGANVASAPTDAPAKQRCVAFRFSGGSVAQPISIALPEGNVKGAESAIFKTLVEKCRMSKGEATTEASMASTWVVRGNAPKSSYKQILRDNKTGFTIQCKAVEAVPTKFAPELHHIMAKKTAPSTVKIMTREGHAKQAHGLTKGRLKSVDKKSVNDWKNDVIDWLSEHESAYADAMRYIGKPADYDPYDDGGLTDSDFEKLVGWICDHDQVREDFEHKFGKSVVAKVCGAKKPEAKKPVTKEDFADVPKKFLEWANAQDNSRKKEVVPQTVPEILAMGRKSGECSSDTFQNLTDTQVDLLYKKFTIDQGMGKDDAFGEIQSIDCNLDNEDDEDNVLDAEPPKKEYTGWQPTSVTFDEDGDVVVAKDDCIKVSLVNLDEGINGDYNPDDPDDVNLLRFDVYYRNPEEGLDDWEPVDDASYCTNIEANSTKEHLEKVVRALFKRYRDEYRNIATGGSVKKMGEELSHIS